MRIYQAKHKAESGWLDNKGSVERKNHDLRSVNSKSTNSMLVLRQLSSDRQVELKKSGPKMDFTLKDEEG
jgi:glycyl-tRNA synthetase (class II)